MRTGGLYLAGTLLLAAQTAAGAVDSGALEDDSASTASYVGYAQVVKADPIVSRQVERTPVKRCAWEYAPVRRRYYDRHDTSSSRRIRRCRTTYESRVDEQITGYDVTLRYNGETFHRRTATHPGTRVPLRVEVVPLDE